jgi:hypothetical protein
MLIGLVGHKQTGKDTVAKMIQYIAFLENHDFEEGDFILDDILSGNDVYDTEYSWGELTESKVSEDSGWEVKKFSTKLKQIVCILTGCTMEQLEDETFKNSLLPDRMQNPEKDRTYRWLMQYMGTEVGRAINENIWVDDLLSSYIGKFSHCPNDLPDTENNCEGCTGNGTGDCNAILSYPNWIISDCRFQNEAEAIAKLGGVLIKINRNESTCSHKSEIELKSITCDYIIDNSGTIQNTYKQIKELWKKIKD